MLVEAPGGQTPAHAQCRPSPDSCSRKSSSLMSASLTYSFYHVNRSPATLPSFYGFTEDKRCGRFCKVQVEKVAITFTSHRTLGRRGHSAKGNVCTKTKPPKLAFKKLDLLLATVASTRLLSTLGGSRRYSPKNSDKCGCRQRGVKGLAVTSGASLVLDLAVCLQVSL